MGRFIVRFVTSGTSRRDAAARAIVERLQASPDVLIIEETPRMVLVEASEKELRQIVDDSDDVVVVPERQYERPNPPFRVKKETE